VKRFSSRGSQDGRSSGEPTGAFLAWFSAAPGRGRKPGPDPSRGLTQAEAPQPKLFFRGFLVHGLRPKFGAYAIPMMTIPCCMIHFGKPLLESLASIVTGMLLGFMRAGQPGWKALKA
jgi:hypothetical protein